MSVQEKQAWYILGVFALVLIALGVAVAIRGIEPEVLGVLGLFGLAGFAPVIGRRERAKGDVIMDERDTEIARKATVAAYSVFWVCFVALCMVPFFVKGPQATLSVRATIPPLLVVLGLVIVFTVRSIAIIVLYRR